MRSTLVLPLLVAFTLACGGVAPAVLPIGAAERELTLDVGDIAPLIPGLVVDPTREKWTLERGFDGTYDLEYEFETADEDPLAVYVSTMASLEPSVSDAEWVYAGAGMGLAIADTEGVQLVETPGLLGWGDERQCHVFQTEGIPFGTMCTARKGRRVYIVSVVGLPLDAPGAMDALLAPQLAAFEAWEPAG